MAGIDYEGLLSSTSHAPAEAPAPAPPAHGKAPAPVDADAGPGPCTAGDGGETPGLSARDAGAGEEHGVLAQIAAGDATLGASFVAAEDSRRIMKERVSRLIEEDAAGARNATPSKDPHGPVAWMGKLFGRRAATPRQPDAPAETPAGPAPSANPLPEPRPADDAARPLPSSAVPGQAVQGAAPASGMDPAPMGQPLPSWTADTAAGTMPIPLPAPDATPLPDTMSGSGDAPAPVDVTPPRKPHRARRVILAACAVCTVLLLIPLLASVLAPTPSPGADSQNAAGAEAARQASYAACQEAAQAAGGPQDAWGKAVADNADAAKTDPATLADPSTLDGLKTALAATVQEPAACAPDAGRDDLDRLTRSWEDAGAAWDKAAQAVADAAKKVADSQAAKTLDDANAALDGQLADARALLGSSDGNVADNRTREDLTKAIDAGQALKDSKSTDAQAIQAAASAIQQAGAKVNESIAKKQADDAAKAAAAKAAADAAAKKKAASSSKSSSSKKSSSSSKSSSGKGAASASKPSSSSPSSGQAGGAPSPTRDPGMNVG